MKSKAASENRGHSNSSSFFVPRIKGENGRAKFRPFFSVSQTSASLQKQDGGAQGASPEPPAAARLTDTTVRVLPAERAMFDQLRSFFQSLPAQFEALLQSPPASEAWIRSDNPNIQAVLTSLNQLVSDLNSENFTIRFDHPGTGESAASYDSLNDEMHVQPFSNDGERNLVAVDLFHEYTHIEQDRLAEAARAAQRTPQAHTREEDLQGEIGARRQQVYFSGLLRASGNRFPGSQRGFNAELSDRVFMRRFERERTAATQRERTAATREIRSEIESNYTGQLERNAAIRTYSVTISADNHAMLHHDVSGQSSPYDLGALPAQLRNISSLRGLLQTRIRAVSFYDNLYSDSSGATFNIITFLVTFQDSKITEFGLQR